MDVYITMHFETGPFKRMEICLIFGKHPWLGYWLSRLMIFKVFFSSSRQTPGLYLKIYNGHTFHPFMYIWREGEFER
jgi:hypothetical protein